ncbi:MAG: toxin [Verrucomicrobia bacterium GWF2_51_19]|nr:MAG: toxin [Verrucomicrobia bacterium GWF2_51_19]HCJ11488.1 toxin [Opitutae bacterium]
MKHFNWSEEKNLWLEENRGISFDDIVFYMSEGFLIDTVRNKKPYAHQEVFLVNIEDYIYLIPFVESETEIFLKTIIPSRKAIKKYLEERML